MVKSGGGGGGGAGGSRSASTTEAAGGNGGSDSVRRVTAAAVAAAVRVLTILPPEELGVMAATMEAEEVPPDAAVLQWGLKVPAGKASSLLRIRPARLLRPSPPTPQALSVRIPRHSTHR